MKNGLMKKMSLGIVSLSAVVLLAACGDTGTTEEPATQDPAVEEPTTDPANEDTTTEDTATDDTTTGDTQQSAAPDTSNGIYNVDFAVTLEEATQSFLDTFGQDVNIDTVEFDDDRGNYEYQISGWDAENDYELDVDATTGEVNEQETDSDTEADHTIEFDNIISPEEAMEVAVEASGSDLIEGWTIDDEDGLTVYEVEIENGDDVIMDAATGSVIPDN